VRIVNFIGSFTVLMKKLSFFLFAFFLVLLPARLLSTHIVGGEMYYEYVGGNNYKITLIVYRDCFKGIPGFDNPGYISVFDSSYNRIEDLKVSPPIPIRVPLENYDSCTWVDTVCYEVAKYEITTSLPPIKGGYILVYDRCCWNWSVNNLVTPDVTGLSVLTTIPDSVFAKNNSSPYFNYRTPVFFCVNRFFEFDHSATDPDGDSLAYEIFTPFNSSRLWDSELAPLPGPYDELIYATGYSLSNVLGGTVPLSIDPKTGYLTATHDNTVGQYVFGVKVKEYRNGIEIGQTARTYQINSQQCLRFTKARFENPIIQCGDSVVTFFNSSDSALGYLWHFGDSNSDDSLSNNEGPTHRYSGLGNFTVKLVAYSYQGDQCNDTTTGTVTLYPDIIGEFNWDDDECSNFVQFDDISNISSGKVISWLWNFGDGTGAVTKNPYHRYSLNNDPRSFVVTMIIENINGCVDSVTQIYTGVNRKYFINKVTASKFAVYPRYDSTLLVADADSAASYSWTPTEGLSSPNEATTLAYPKQLTLYKVVVTDNRGCKAEGTVEINVFKYSCGESIVYVPNAFSPNGDGENDFLRVRGEEIRYLRLSVYNRWGQLVFESQNPNMTGDITLGWDGIFNGELQEPGVYVYKLEVECSDNRTFNKKGNITLIR